MEADGDPEPRRELLELALEKAAAGDLELGPGRGESGLGERLDQEAEVLVRDETAGADDPDRAGVGRGGRTRGGRGVVAAAAARKGSTSAAWSATAIRSSGTPNASSRARAAELAAINPSARPPSQRCSRSCQSGSSGSIPGVHSVKITYARRCRRHQANARSDAGPYSDTTTQSGSVARSSRSSPRGQITGVRPARWRCQERRWTAGYGCSLGNHSAGTSQLGWPAD